MNAQQEQRLTELVIDLAAEIQRWEIEWELFCQRHSDPFFCPGAIREVPRGETSGVCTPPGRNDFGGPAAAQFKSTSSVASPHIPPQVRLPTDGVSINRSMRAAAGPAVERETGRPGGVESADLGRQAGPSNPNAGCYDQVHVFPKGRWSR